MIKKPKNRFSLNRITEKYKSNATLYIMILMEKKKCVICKKEFIPKATDPIQPYFNGKVFKWYFMHKKCYNKQKESE